MNKITINLKDTATFSLHCPFTNEKLDSEENSFEVYEGAGNYLFSMCEDCLFCDVGNNDEIDKHWNDSALEAIEKFVSSYPEKNILVIEVLHNGEKYYYGFLNEKNQEIDSATIEKNFIK